MAPSASASASAGILCSELPLSGNPRPETGNPSASPQPSSASAHRTPQALSSLSGVPFVCRNFIYGRGRDCPRNGFDCSHYSHEWPSHVHQGIQCQTLQCTTKGSAHYVDFYCLSCDELIVS